MTPKPRLMLAGLALSVALSSAEAARAAGPDAADALFNTGIEQMEAGHYAKACPAIEQSLALDPLPGTLFTLAECEAKRGRAGTALARYEEYLAVYARLPVDKKRKQGDREATSRAAMATLARQAPQVTLTLAPGAPPGTVVTRDHLPMAATALGAPMTLDSGDHVFATQAPGGPPTEKVVSLKPGDRAAVVLDVAAAAVAPVAPPPAAPPPEAPPAPSAGLGGRRLGAIGSFAVGGVGLILGAVTGGLALGKKSTVNADCGIGGDPTACSATGLAAADSLKTLGNVSSFGFVLAGVGAATGVVLLVTEPKPSGGSASSRAPVRLGFEPSRVFVDFAW